MVVLKENKINHLLDNQHLNLSSGLDSLNCNTCAAVPSELQMPIHFRMGATNYVKFDSQTTGPIPSSSSLIGFTWNKKWM